MNPFPNRALQHGTRSRTLLLVLGVMLFFISLNAQDDGNSLRMSKFDMDVTPPVDRDFLTYNKQVGTWDLGLRAKGVVIRGAGAPIVLCAIDWIAISNEGMDAFKGSLAEAVGTTPERVSVNVLHQHDAP